MNSTALAVLIIIFAAFALAAMAGVSGFTFGRVRGTDAAEKNTKKDERLRETLVDIKVDILFMSELLLFTQSRGFDYREVALEAIAEMSPDDPRKRVLESKLQKIDEQIEKKVIELEEREG